MQVLYRLSSKGEGRKPQSFKKIIAHLKGNEKTEFQRIISFIFHYSFCGNWKEYIFLHYPHVSISLYADRSDTEVVEGMEEMPVGNPKPQTVATRKYEQKAGWVSKSYKLKKEVVEAYAEACKKAGVSAAGQITRMMQAFIEQVNKDSEKDI